MPQARSLSTLNQSFLFLSTLVNGNSCEVMELSGRLDLLLFEQAIHLAVARHPVLNSRIRRRFFGYVWEESVDTLPLEIRRHQLEDCDVETLYERLTANVWDEPLDLTAGRPLRVHLTEVDGRTFIQLVTTHIWSDARAGYHLAADLATAYTELAAGRSPRFSRIDVTDRNSARLLAANLPRPRLYYWLSACGLIMRDLFTFDRSLELRSPMGPSKVRCFNLGSDRLIRIKHQAHRLGVTVHALLTVALLRACETYNQGVGHAKGGKYRLLDLFSLRSFAQTDISDLYDTLVIPFSVRLNPELSCEELVREVAHSLEKLKTGDILAELFRHRIYAVAASFLPKRFATRMVTRFVAKSHVIGTNPGPIPFRIDAFGPVPVTDFYSFSQLFPPGRIMCIFSTFRDSLRLIVVYDSQAFQGAQLDLFVEPLLEALDRLTRDVADSEITKAFIPNRTGLI